MDASEIEAQRAHDELSRLRRTAEAAATLINRSIVDGVSDPTYGLYVEITTDVEVWEAFYAATKASGGVKPPKVDAV